MSRSLESVLSEPRPRAHTVGVIRVDQQARLLPSVMAARSMVQQDPRRFSEASISINPPPRPPPPNLKRLNIKPQRRTSIHPALGTTWPPPVILVPPAQPQPQPPPQHQLQQGIGGSNLGKLTHMARSTPQLDEYTDNRERDRERERNRDRDKSPHVQNTRDSLISQVRAGFIIVFFSCVEICWMD